MINLFSKYLLIIGLFLTIFLLFSFKEEESGYQLTNVDEVLRADDYFIKDSLMPDFLKYPVRKRDKLKAHWCYLKGEQYYQSEQWDSAYCFFRQSILYSPVNDYYERGMALRAMSLILYNGGDGIKSESYLLRSDEAFGAIHNGREICFNELIRSDMLIKKGLLNSAMELCEKVMTLREDSCLLSLSYQKMGLIYYANRDDSCLYYFRKSSALSRSDLSTRSESYYWMGHYYLLTGMNDSASFYLNHSLADGISMSLKNKVYEDLSYLLSSEGDFETAYTLLNEVITNPTESFITAESFDTMGDPYYSLTHFGKSGCNRILKKYWIVICFFWVMIFVGILFAAILDKRLRESFHVGALRRLREQAHRISENYPPHLRYRGDTERQFISSIDLILPFSNSERLNQVVDISLNGFATRLMSRHHLNDKEFALACMVLLEFSVIDICSIMGYTTESVYTVKKRLSKKMNLKGSSELLEYLELIQKESK